MQRQSRHYSAYLQGNRQSFLILLTLRVIENNHEIMLAANGHKHPEVAFRE